MSNEFLSQPGELFERKPYVHMLEDYESTRKFPSMYEVILLNDETTPMDFIIFALKTVFRRSHEDATRITLQTHQDGQGKCGIYTRDVAETKMMQVIELARANHYPLKCIIHKKNQS